MRGIQQIEQGADQGEQREGANTAWPLLVRAGVEFLEGKAQKKSQGNQQ